MTVDQEPDKPVVIRETDPLRVWLRTIRSSGQTLGLVPTMGALHAGHMSLVERSRRDCQLTAVTLFVNPTQFGPSEDFSRYPRTWDTDLEQLRQADVDLVFVPPLETIYPDGFSTYVEPPQVAQPLEGACRPGHFRGVATIVLKLFHLVPADVAYFGQKDFQQVRVIEQMVLDLDLPLTIETCPIIREQDGLALSSRNRYLSDDQRQRALGLVRSLKRAQALFGQGERRAAPVLAAMRSELERAGVSDHDYVALGDPVDLLPVDTVTADTMALVAARVGNTRLIDNCRMGSPIGS